MSRILMVDEDRILLRNYQSKLSKEGFTVDAVADGTTAIRELREQPPDVVLLDLVLPDMTGVDVIRAVRSETSLRDIPIIVLSNIYLTEDSDAAKLAGANIVLAKSSTSPRMVLDAIRILLDSSAMHRISPPVPLPVRDVPLPELPVHYTPSVARAVASDELPELTGQFVIGPVFSKQIEPYLAVAAHQIKELRHAGDNRSLVESTFHTIGDLAVSAHRWDVAKIAAACESLMRQLQAAPEKVPPSPLRTLEQAIHHMAPLAEAKHADTDMQHVRVMVIDDDPISRALVAGAWAKVELDATLVDDPAQAPSIAAASPFNVIVCDLKIGCNQASPLTTALRAIPGYHDVPIIHITGTSDFLSNQDKLTHMHDDLIAKPFMLMELGVKALLHVMRDAVHLPAVTDN